MPDAAARPLVSIVIPTYNRARFLREAVESALAQTYPNLQVLVLDDASTDDTPGVAGAFSGDARLTYVRRPANAGPNTTWREGIAAAKGEFFCMLPDDDRLDASFVEALAAPLVADDSLVVCFCDHRIIDAGAVHLEQETHRTAADHGRLDLPEGPVADLARTLLIDESAYVGAALFRRSVIGPDSLDARAHSAMGGWLFYQCVRSGRGGYYVRRQEMSCRWVAGSVSRSRLWRPTILLGNIFRYRRMLADPGLARFHPLLRRWLAGELAALARHNLSVHDPQAARAAARESLSLRVNRGAVAVLLLAALGPLGPRLAGLARRALGRPPAA